MTALDAVDLEQVERLRRLTNETVLEVAVVRLGLRDLDARLERLERRREHERSLDRRRVS